MLRISSQQRGSPDEQRRADHRYPRGNTEKRVTEMAAQISKDYEGEEILIVGLLKGAILFVADLVRKLTVPSSINFIIASSYGHGVSIKSKKIILHTIKY